MLDDETFLEIISATPLVSIDLIVEDKDGNVLLGKRVNRPARGYWFVPGGRIMKDETLAEAFKRIAAAELGISVSLSDATLSGAFDHIYEDNRFAVEGITTQYVVLAYELSISDKTEIKRDQKHTELKWLTNTELLINPDVHQHTKPYFAST